MKINKQDTVVLPDGSAGKVLEVYPSHGSITFKVKKFDDGEEMYLGQSEVKLKKRTLGNLISALLEGTF